MSEDDLNERVRAVERALTEADTDVASITDAAAIHERLDALTTDVEALSERLDALDATVQSIHGYVGELEHVNDRVERRADAARAAVERLDDQRFDSRRRRAAPNGDTNTAENAERSNSRGTDNDSGATEARTDGTLTPSTTGNHDTHSLLDAGDDGPHDVETSRDESLLDRVRKSL